jgi:RNA chaperone Hfq
VAKTSINIQDGFLFQHLKAGTTLAVGLTTGKSLSGKLKRFDRFALVLDAGNGEILVYKHAVATLEEAAVLED